MNKFESLLKLREKLNRAEPSVGSWMQLPSSEIGEILGSAGYEWVAVDLDHHLTAGICKEVSERGMIKGFFDLHAQMKTVPC